MMVTGTTYWTVADGKLRPVAAVKPGENHSAAWHAALEA